MVSEGSSHNSTAVWEVEQGQSKLGLAAELPSSATTLYEEAKADYDSRKALYDAELEQGGATPEPPMEPLKLELFAADIFGLENARRACRFEMIKIVREVSSSHVRHFLPLQFPLLQGGCCGEESPSCLR